MSLILTRPWTRQPQQSVGINWASPLSQGLVSAFSPSLGVREIGPSQLARTYGANTVVELRNVGHAMLFDGAATGLGYSGNSVAMVPTSKPFTVYLYAYWDRSTIGWIFGDYDSGGSNASVAVQTTSTSTLLVVTASTSATLDSAFFFPSSGWYTWVFSQSFNGVFSAWCNGRNFGNTATTAARASSGSGTFRIGGAGSYTGGALTSAEVALAFITSAPCTDTLATEFAKNPWQIFAPGRLIIPITATTSAVPSITAVYADSVLTDRATPRVTLDYA
jgi:hypothetical protein